LNYFFKIANYLMSCWKHLFCCQAQYRIYKNFLRHDALFPGLRHACVIATRFLKITIIAINTLLLFACERTKFPSGHLFHPTSKPIVASPLVEDFNHDGKLEIAAGSLNGEFYFLDDSLRVLSTWPSRNEKSTHTAGGFYSSATAWDIDRDNSPEIFVGSENGKLFGWQIQAQTNAPSALANFPIQLGGLIWSSPTIIADSLIAIGGAEKMFLFDRRGTPAAGWPQPFNGWAEATAAWHGDVLAITTLIPGEASRGYLYVWHLNGELYPNFPINLKMDSNSSPTLADLDNDGRVDIIVGDDAGFLHVFTLDGSELPGFPRLAGDRIESSPTVVDLDGDNTLDILVGAADGYVYAWNAVGDVRLGWPVATKGEVSASVAVADIYGEGRLAVIVGSRDHRLYAFYEDGTLARGFPIDCGDKIFSSPWVGDIDSDGWTDIVVGANNGLHRICNIGKLGAVPWPMFRHNIRRTGAISNQEN
jgi:hypothetical protein